MTAKSSRPLGRKAAAHEQGRSGYLFILPALLGFALFAAFPIGTVFAYSFSDFNTFTGESTFIGLANYEKLLTDPTIPSVVASTGIFSIGLVATNLTLALVLALLLNRKLRARAVFRVSFFSPVVVSLVAWTLVWNALLQDNGAINGFLGFIGIDGPNWLREPASAMAAVILVQLIKGVGINMILFLAALQDVPRSLIEAAMVDGANAWQRFWRITFFIISPTVLLTSILTVAGSLQVFAQIQILTSGGPGNATDVVVFYLYRQAFQNHNIGYGSALAVVLFLVVVLLTLGQWQIKKRWISND